MAVSVKAIWEMTQLAKLITVLMGHFPPLLRCFSLLKAF